MSKGSERMKAWRLANPEKYAALKLRSRDKDIARSKKWIKDNPDRAKASNRKWRQENKEKLRIAAAEWRAANPEKAADTVRNFYQARPWYKSWQAAKSRCNTPTTTGYQYYGGRGIEFHLTQDECRIMWERDGAANQECPSLDRIDSSGHYVFDNCRYIEAAENSRLGGMNSALSKRAARARLDAERIAAIGRCAPAAPAPSVQP